MAYLGRVGTWVRRFIDMHLWVWPASTAVVLWLVASGISGHLSSRTLFINASLAVFLALAGVAQMVIIMSGDGSFDLSLPYNITISALISTGVLGAAGPGRLSAILEALGAGLILGLCNGLLTALLKMPALIASLATGYVVYSIILLLQVNQAAGASGVSAGLANFLQHQIDGASTVLLVGVVVAVVVHVTLTRTVYGRYLQAMGQSRPAARLAGIGLNKMIVANFMVSGVLGAATGVILAAYDGGAFQNIGAPYLLGSVGAVVVGGNAVSGGRSSVAATMFGALVMTLLLTVLEISGLSAGYQDIIDGVAVISIVSLAKLSQAGASE